MNNIAGKLIWIILILNTLLNIASLLAVVGIISYLAGAR